MGFVFFNASTVVLLAVAALPQMAMPPTPCSGEEDKKGEQERDNQRERCKVRCSQPSIACLEIKGERQERADDEHEKKEDENWPADSHAKIRNASMLR